jgi:acyl dehydratase
MRLADVAGAVGETWGPTGWVDVTAAQVADYRAATGDEAGAGVPPLMVLALTNLFLPDLFLVEDAATGVNYGTGAVRFPATSPVGRLRATAELVACDEVRGGLQTTVRVTVEAEGRDDPVCVVDAISRWLS